MHRIFPIALVASVALAPTSEAADRLSLKSVSVDLPFGDRMFPDGPGSAAANNHCLACHSVGMVLNQPALPRAEWLAVVEKMRTAYKAPIDPKVVNGIVDYLVTIKGTR